MLTGPIVNDAVAKGDFIPLLVEAVGRERAAVGSKINSIPLSEVRREIHVNYESR